jgi:MFS family permease
MRRSVLEIEVKAYRRVIHRHRYSASCQCGCVSGIVCAPLLAMTLAMVVGSTLGGQLAARLGSRRAAMIGTSVALLGGVLLLPPLVSLQSFLPSLLALGLGLAISTPAANAASMAAAQPHESGMASAASGTLRYLGGVCGVAMVSTLASGDNLIHALHISALVFVLALGLAGVLATLIPSGADGSD